MAILDGLANTAFPQKSLPCKAERAISPMSATGQGVIRIYENPDLPGSLSYGKAKRTLYLVWGEIVLAERRFGHMTLVLEYAGVEIGTMVIGSTPPRVWRD